ncbi:DNA double-strand break repair nuclease NurA [Candidatus Leptofilum sp.]|uniref:DNA double-strand break repair nuclease NurA n=1 Tax=Candidatus Leptofilum sp. TaxID=3241576 RepID=UPI003B59089E
MTLEFEKLTADLEKMAQTTARRLNQRRERVAEGLDTLKTYRTNWTAVAQALQTAQEKSDEKYYRSARPFSHNEPLDSHIPAPSPPPQATIVAADGSQIMPDRHAAHLYYLINVGGIIYHHGSGRTPETFSQPDIVYPDSDETIDNFNDTPGAVSIERDLKEIETLARKTAANRHNAQPLLSILDQRLLYWPIGSAGVADNYAVTTWGEHMTGVHQAGALLCGYIDRPGTSAVMTLLRSIAGLSDANFDWKELGKRKATQGVTDADIFAQILKPGERSAVFANISDANSVFMTQDEANEVCFFYLNPGLSGKNIARVDIPRWVAEDAGAVTAVHSLLIDQCRIMGNYPYVIARADEMAVVGRQDASELNFMIDVIMERHGISNDITSKQGSKDLARGGRTRHEGI